MNTLKKSSDEQETDSRINNQRHSWHWLATETCLQQQVETERQKNNLKITFECVNEQFLNGISAI